MGVSGPSLPLYDTVGKFTLDGCPTGLFADRSRGVDWRGDRLSGKLQMAITR